MPGLTLLKPRLTGAKLRVAPLALVAISGLLSGCAGSGYWSYLGDTFTLPFGANPNAAQGSSETYAKVRAASAEPPPPLLYEPGDVWPAPPKAPPTLKDLQAQQNREISAGESGANYAPLTPLPQLPGYEVPEQQAHPATPRTTFPGGIVPLPQGKTGVVTGGGEGVKSMNGPTGNGSIVVPNGNGTSTVIGPNGTVSTIPTPGK
jgi:hypothetical protein